MGGDDLDEEVEGYRVPVCRALTIDITILGVSREMFILNCTLATVFVVGIGMWYLTPVNVILHFILKKVSEKDTKMLKIYAQKYTKQKQYYHEG